MCTRSGPPRILPRSYRLARPFRQRRYKRPSLLFGMLSSTRFCGSSMASTGWKVGLLKRVSPGIILQEYQTFPRSDEMQILRAVLIGAFFVAAGQTQTVTLYM